MEKSKIGVIGLAVMGENLVMNMESKGFRVKCRRPHDRESDAFSARPGPGKNRFRGPIPWKNWLAS